MRSAILEDLDPKTAPRFSSAAGGRAPALKRSLDYPENSAGRLMQTRLIAVPPFWTSAQTIDYMRDRCRRAAGIFFELFVVDPGHRLLGTVLLDRLLRTKRQARLDGVMEPNAAACT